MAHANLRFSIGAGRAPPGQDRAQKSSKLRCPLIAYETSLENKCRRVGVPLSGARDGDVAFIGWRCNAPGRDLHRPVEPFWSAWCRGCRSPRTVRASTAAMKPPRSRRLRGVTTQQQAIPLSGMLGQTLRTKKPGRHEGAGQDTQHRDDGLDCNACSNPPCPHHVPAEAGRQSQVGSLLGLVTHQHALAARLQSIAETVDLRDGQR
jgi:hypothetical protein